MKRIYPLIAIFAIGLGPMVVASDVYRYLPLRDLRLTQGKIPVPNSAEIERGGQQRRTRWGATRPFEPHVEGVHGEEMYLEVTGPRRSWSAWEDYSGNVDNTFLASHFAEGETPRGILFLPNADWSGMVRIEFEIPTDIPASGHARKDFLEAKEAHYRRLHASGIPGGAWYRHQLTVTEAALHPGKKESETAQTTARQRADRNRGTELERSFSLFSGGRAVSENLQLDRDLLFRGQGSESISVDQVQGITVSEIDWTEWVEGLEPEKDPLARLIPADQHVLFFPSFTSMTTIIDEAKDQGSLLLRLAETRSEDAGTQGRYERQLCLSLDSLTRLIGPALISSVAFTGSDPYLRTGSDVAVLFETSNPSGLLSAIRSRQSAATVGFPAAEQVEGTLGDVSYHGVVSPDRTVCSYSARIGDTVAVTNSLVQLESLIDTYQGNRTALTSLDEYTFFRDRYKRGAPEETALLLVTDATIRRWCGPKWRILASRRTRAAGAMSEIQAKHLGSIASGDVSRISLDRERFSKDLGDLSWTSNGIQSSLYGSLEFLTPIAEMPIDRVSLEEKEAYDRFRSNYQRKWRRYFDPLAVRFSITDGSIETDLSIRPLIADTDYRQFIDVAGTRELQGSEGDPHAESLLQFAMSVDRESEVVQQYGNFLLQMTPGVGATGLNWIGDWLTLYVDQDPFWAEVQTAAESNGRRGAEEYLQNHFMHLPIGVVIDVANPFTLAGFLTGLRAFIQQTAPGLTVWENLEWKGQPYVRISQNPASDMGFRIADATEEWGLYYAPNPKGLIFTLNEPLLHRALDRMTQSTAEQTSNSPGITEWLGGNLNVQAQPGALLVLQTLFRESLESSLRQRSWSNLPILNEWRKRYQAEDPVAFHRRYWQTHLVCPAGGQYIWNEEYRTMESTVFGHPGEPKEDPELDVSFFNLHSAGFGVTFEEDGLRARVQLERKKE